MLTLFNVDFPRQYIFIIIRHIYIYVSCFQTVISLERPLFLKELGKQQHFTAWFVGSCPHLNNQIMARSRSSLLELEVLKGSDMGGKGGGGRWWTTTTTTTTTTSLLLNRIAILVYVILFVVVLIFAWVFWNERPSWSKVMYKIVKAMFVCWFAFGGVWIYRTLSNYK